MKERNPREQLHRAIPRYAAAAGIPEQRLRTWLSFIAVAGALQRAVDGGRLESYQIKGGVALELRFPGRARTTSDLDVGIPARRQDRLEQFTRALSLGFDGFSFRVKQRLLEMNRADAIRAEVVVSYQGRGHQTIEVDLGPADADDVEDVFVHIDVADRLGITVPPTLVCVSLPAQIAQKIHASTHPSIVADPRQDRARDIIDILMLESLGAIDHDAVRVAAARTFAARATHEWPVVLPDYPAIWRRTLERLAGDIGLPCRTADDILVAYSAFVSRVTVWPVD